MIRVRKMERRDVPSVCRVVQAAYEFLADEQGYSRKQRRRLLEERCSPEWVGPQFLRWRSFVAISGRRVVGVLAVNGAEIEELFVHPEEHRHGIGTRLFRKAEEVIADDGHPHLIVRTTGYAVPFYEGMGARVIGKERVTCGPLVGWPCTVLSKDITKKRRTARPVESPEPPRDPHAT